MLKKFLSVIVAVSMVCSIATSAFAEEIIQNKSNAVTFNTDHSSDETVTFIVEVEGDPTFASAAAKKIGAAAYSKTADAKYAEAKNLYKQSKVMEKIKNNVIPSAKKDYTYTALFNGFSVEGKMSDREAILALDGVKNVYVSQTHYLEKPLIADAKVQTGVPEIVESMGLKGEGQVVAVIDSEFDTSHDFFNTPVDNPKYSKEDIDKLIKNTQLNVNVDSANQVYKNTKIPFAYDYVNHSSDTYNSNPNIIHGTHVAGIVAGKNGVSPDGKTLFSGVAPEAQLILMKVSDENGGLPDSAIFAALDDAAKFGVSVINASLGIKYVSYLCDLDIEKFYETARDAGIFLSVSAGNASRGYMDQVPLAENIDYSAAGIPTSISATTAVASVDNSSYFYELGNLNVDDTEIKYAEAFEDSNFASNFSDKPYEYVFCGYGKKEEISGLDLKGKIALVKRGQIFYTEKSDNAKAAGAVGLIIINTEDFYNKNINPVSLPTAWIISSDGNTLINANKKVISVTIPTFVKMPIENVGKISSFSSWGVSETLELKPEISAPGGKIYSSVPDNKYDTFSGTSMSAPHITGLVALTNQFYETNPYVDKYNGLSGTEKVALFENILMSSASIIRNDNGIADSPRHQGAGLVNIKNALNTPVILIGNSGKSKISLGDKIENSFSLTFTAQNLTENEVTYDSLSLEVMTDGYETNDGKNYVGGIVKLKAQSDLPSSVTIPSSGEKEITVNVTLDKDELEDNSKIFTNGFYIDGYVSLSRNDENICAVNIPFMGFRGNWSKAPIFDTTIYDENGSCLYLPQYENSPGTFLGSDNDKDSYDVLGQNYFSKEKIINKDYIAISPNGDGVFDNLVLYLQLFRSLSQLAITVTDLEGNPVIDDTTFDEPFAKFWMDSIQFPNLSQIPDGDYIITLKGRYIYPANDEDYNDEMTLPFTIDTQRPTVTSVDLSEDKSSLTITASDNKYISAIEITYPDENGETQWQTRAFDPLGVDFENDICATFDITGIDTDEININVYDYAMNCEEGSVSDYTEDVRAELIDLQQLGGMTFARINMTNRSEHDLNGVIIATFCDEEGKLLQIETQNVTLAHGSKEVQIKSFKDTTDAAKMKVMFWNELGKMNPLFSGKLFDLKQN